MKRTIDFNAFDDLVVGGPMTEEDTKVISAYIQAQKKKNAAKKAAKKKTTHSKKSKTS